MDFKSWAIFAIILVFIDVNHCDPGDKANKECKENGLKMLECKKILHGDKNRIPADLIEFPHMALIGYEIKSEKSLVWNCGGTLISSEWILTAAHCLKDPRAGLPKVAMLGMSALDEEEPDPEVVQRRNITELISHAENKPPAKYNDIALLKMDVPIVLGQIRVACLHAQFELPPHAIASGFGKLKFDDDRGSAELMQVELPFIDQLACNHSLKSLIRKKLGPIPKGIMKSQLCAGDLINGGKDACQGDSGGPLQYLHNNPDCQTTFPLYTVVGVTSFGRFCGFKQSPGIYTRVSEYISWIENIVWPD